MVDAHSRAPRARVLRHACFLPLRASHTSHICVVSPLILTADASATALLHKPSKDDSDHGWKTSIELCMELGTMIKSHGVLFTACMDS